MGSTNNFFVIGKSKSHLTDRINAGFGISLHDNRSNFGISSTIIIATVEDFLEWFPGVGRAQVEEVLDHEVKHSGLAPA